MYINRQRGYDGEICVNDLHGYRTPATTAGGSGVRNAHPVGAAYYAGRSVKPPTRYDASAALTVARRGDYRNRSQCLEAAIDTEV